MMYRAIAVTVIKGSSDGKKSSLDRREGDGGGGGGGGVRFGLEVG